MITEYNTVSEANWARFVEGRLKNSNNYNIQFWVNKLVEELGELSAAFNKDKGSLNEQEEVGDMAIVLDLITQLRKLPNLDQCMRLKFNATSIEKGSEVRVKI